MKKQMTQCQVCSMPLCKTQVVMTCKNCIGGAGFQLLVQMKTVCISDELDTV